MTGSPIGPSAVTAALPAGPARRLALALAPVLGLTGLAAAALQRGLVLGPSFDAAVFMLVARTMARGGMPYRDAWDDKPPVVYAVEALMQAAFPGADPWHLAWIFTVLATAGTGLAVWYALRGSCGTVARSAAAGATTLLLGSSVLSLGGGHTESIAVFPATAAFALLVHRRTPLRLVLSGIALGLAVMTSALMVPVAIGCLVLIVADLRSPSRRAGWPKVAGSILLWGAAGLAVGLATVAWLWLGGAWPEAFDALVTYVAVYARVNRANPTFIQPLFEFVIPMLFCLILPVLLMLRGVIEERRIDLVTAAALAWLVAQIVLIASGARLVPHYALLAVPAFGLVAAPTFERTWRLVASADRRRLLAVTLLGFGATVSLLTSVIRSDWYRPAISEPLRVAAAQRIVELTAPTDSILIWGNEPELHLLANRGLATKWIFFDPLATPGYATPELIAGIARQMEANPPALVIDVGSPAPGEPGRLPLLIDRPVNIIDGRTLDLLDPLREIIRRDYRYVGTVSGWPVYVRNGAAA